MSHSADSKSKKSKIYKKCLSLDLLGEKFELKADSEGDF